MKLAIPPKQSSLWQERLRWANIRPRPSLCDDCPCNPSTRGFDPLTGGGFVPPSGPPDAPLTIVGIVPGEEEEVRGEPLTGPSGRWVTEALKWGNGSEMPLRKLNVCNCRTTKIGLQGKVINRTPPTAREMQFCMERWLMPELAHTKSKLVLLVGVDAYKASLEEAFGKFGVAIGHRLAVPRAYFRKSIAERRLWAHVNRGDIGGIAQ